MKLTDEQQRTVISSTSEHGKLSEYCTNFIKTSKYTWYTFLVINMYEQFRRVSNAYFLILMILQLIPQISSLSPITTILPLVTVISLSAIKDIYDDYLRHRNDEQVNNRICEVYRYGRYTNLKWKDIVVGDIIKIKSEEKVPADIVLLSTTNDGLCLIETAELDGETNLKPSNSPHVIAEWFDESKLEEYNLKIICELPNKNLDKFEGRLEIDDKSPVPLSKDNVVLRGCVVRNTESVVGIVVFTGRDSKIMMNSGKLRLKNTHLDSYINKVISQILLFLFFCVVILITAQGIWEKLIGVKLKAYIPFPSFLPSNVDSAISVKAILSFFSFVIIMNAIIPISLYVSVEFVRFWHSMFVNWDDQMYDALTDSYAKARTTALIEELGQIQYIFSDKTGTLTQNLMKFQQCSINGVKYRNSPELLREKIASGDKMVNLFMEILSICHTVMANTSEDGQGVTFQAQSPDEGALVEAASEFGYTFVGRTNDEIKVKVGEKVKIYKILAILDFDNIRKRMSVVVRCEGRLMLLTKGADTTIYSVLSNDRSGDCGRITSTHLNEFACSGLRTLCMAYKDISEEDWGKWFEGYNNACLTTNQAEAVDKSIADLETNLNLVGATGIEDKLQENVADTIYSLSEAKIRIWVLTGDKLETAVNIGYSCSLLTNEMYEVFILECVDKVDVISKINEYLGIVSKILTDMNIDPSEFKKAYDNFSAEYSGFSGFALVLTGQSLEIALTHSEQTFVDLASCCRTVICCRVTPLQKSQVVSLIRKHKKAITLSIGDGANDVSMIKAADIGIGISGKEGRQAVLASDYSISQFRFLERLILTHGRLSYYRMCRFMSYFFYKSFAFAFSQFIFAFFSGFSAQLIYNPIFMASYNMFYTSVPVLVMAIFDKDITNEAFISNPNLYDAGLRNKLFNQRVFLTSAIEGCISATVITLSSYITFKDAVNSKGINIDDLYTVQHVVMTILTFVVTVRCALYMNTWTTLHHISIWGSILAFFSITLFFSSGLIDTTALGASFIMLESPLFWFLLPLVITVLIMPIVFYKTIQIRFRPSFAQKLITTINFETNKNTFSLRHGYAFSQYSGIGDFLRRSVAK